MVYGPIQQTTPAADGTPITKRKKADSGAAIINVPNEKELSQQVTTQTKPIPLTAKKETISTIPTPPQIDVSNIKTAPPTPEQVLQQQVTEQGGYIDESGKYIPSTLPKKEITFNDDGTVTYKTKEGQTYNLTKDEYKALVRGEGKITRNVKEVQAIEGGALQKIQLQQAIDQIGQIDQTQLQNLQEAPIDIGQALTAGAMGVAPAAAGGALTMLAAAKVGGAVGAAAGPVGAAGGAVIGAAVGMFIGIQRNIASQQKGEIASNVDVLTAAKTNMRQLAMLASQNPANAEAYIQLYNQQLTQVHRAYRQVKLETQGNLNKYIEDGTDILSDFELFLQQGGTADIYGQKLQIALNSGIPISVEDLAFLELSQNE